MNIINPKQKRQRLPRNRYVFNTHFIDGQVYLEAMEVIKILKDVCKTFNLSEEDCDNVNKFERWVMVKERRIPRGPDDPVRLNEEEE